MSDEQMIKVLATNGMGWRADYSEVGGWYVDATGNEAQYILDWNPLTDLNTVATIEARLTREQRRQYMKALFDYLLPQEIINWSSDVWLARHASPRTCCEALVKVLQSEDK